MAQKILRKPQIKEGRVYTREEMQQMLKERIARGDKAAERIRDEYRRVDRLLDVFREKPIYNKE